jgi:hypothetical protein
MGIGVEPSMKAVSPAMEENVYPKVKLKIPTRLAPER